MVQILSPSQILQYAENAGFTGQSAQTITAISLAESGGNPGNINYSDPGGSYGLTQVNAKAWGPGYAQAALDPQTALDEAYSISKGGTDFSPWSTFKSGAYSNYLGEVGASNANPLDQAPSLSIDSSSPGTISGQGAYSGLSSGAPGLAAPAAAGGTLNQQLQNDTNAQNQTAGNTSKGILASIGDWFQRGGIMLFAMLAALAALLWLGMETKAGKQTVAAVSKVAA